jgi:hypothetical protein
MEARGNAFLLFLSTHSNPQAENEWRKSSESVSNSQKIALLISCNETGSAYVIVMSPFRCQVSQLTSSSHGHGHNVRQCTVTFYRNLLNRLQLSLFTLNFHYSLFPVFIEIRRWALKCVSSSSNSNDVKCKPHLMIIVSENNVIHTMWGVQNIFTFTSLIVLVSFHFHHHVHVHVSPLARSNDTIKILKLFTSKHTSCSL